MRRYLTPGARGNRSTFARGALSGAGAVRIEAALTVSAGRSMVRSEAAARSDGRLGLRGFDIARTLVAHALQVKPRATVSRSLGQDHAGRPRVLGAPSDGAQTRRSL